MALITGHTAERRSVPHEPGEWIAFRPLTYADSKRINRLAEEERSDAILRATIVGWSYDAPVTAETIDCLDVVTAVWAAQEVTRGMRSPAEGEVSAPA